MQRYREMCHKFHPSAIAQAHNLAGAIPLAGSGARAHNAIALGLVLVLYLRTNISQLSLLSFSAS